jgi:hypothetical protein
MMSLVRAQLGEPQQSSLLTTLFSFAFLFMTENGASLCSKKYGSMSIVGVALKQKVPEQF